MDEGIGCLLLNPFDALRRDNGQLRASNRHLKGRWASQRASLFLQRSSNLLQKRAETQTQDLIGHVAKPKKVKHPSKQSYQAEVESQGL